MYISRRKKHFDLQSGPFQNLNLDELTDTTYVYRAGFGIRMVRTYYTEPYWETFRPTNKLYTI